MAEIKDMVGYPVTPQDSIAFWNQKVPVIGEVYHINEESKTRAFTVARAKNIDQVFKVKNAIGEALINGDSFETFKEKIADVIQECDIPDWMVETIFRTNIQSAYMAGRYKQMQDNKTNLPYWRYVTAGDGRVRDSHQQLNNVVYPADDPFWDNNFPPNGFNCRCTVVAMTKSKMERLQKEGKITLKSTPEGGRAKDIDSHFNNNPGKNWMAGLENQCVTAIERDVPADLETLPEKYVRKYTDKDLLHLPDELKNGDEEKQNEWYALQFLKEFGIDTIDGYKTIILPGINYPVVISKQLFWNKKQNKLKANKNDRGQYMKILAQNIKQPNQIHAGILKNGHSGIIVTNIFKINNGDRQACYTLFSRDENQEKIPTIYKPELVFSGTTTFVPEDINYLKDKTKKDDRTKRERIWKEK